MKWMIFSLVIVILARPTYGEVVVYPAPPNERLSDDYSVSVVGQSVPVYIARTLDPPFAGKQWDYGGPYSFANFDTDEPLEVRITSPRNLANTVIRPPCTPT